MSLISTSDLRTWMGTADGDTKGNAKLSMIAQAVEDFVNSFTNRRLVAQTYYNDPSYCYFDGTGKPYIYLPLYPLSYVSEVNVDSNRTFGSATLIASSDFYWYPSGKIEMDSATGLFGRFSKGRRNIRIQYTAGYAPVVGGTYNSSVSTYPLPNDLKQTMIEMCVESFKEGMTAVHTVQTQDQVRFTQMLSGNTFWANVLNKYKAFDNMFASRDE